MDFEIKKGNNKFYIGEDEKHLIAEITYLMDENENIIANHTYVSPRLRGQGIAKMLLDQLVLFARSKHLKIIPKCSYVVKVFQEDNSFQDVWLR